MVLTAQDKLQQSSKARILYSISIKGDSQKQIVSAPRNSGSSPEMPNKNPSQYWSPAYAVSPLEIIERSENLEDCESPRYEVQKKGRMALEVNSDDLKEGYVYMCEAEGNERYVKIGYTSRTLERCHSEWKLDCNRLSKVLHPPSSNPQRVPNGHRVEALCHAELDHRRMGNLLYWFLEKHD
jgi:hypothetical protein